MDVVQFVQIGATEVIRSYIQRKAISSAIAETLENAKALKPLKNKKNSHLTSKGLGEMRDHNKLESNIDRQDLKREACYSHSILV